MRLLDRINECRDCRCRYGLKCIFSSLNQEKGLSSHAASDVKIFFQSPISGLILLQFDNWRSCQGGNAGTQGKRRRNDTIDWTFSLVYECIKTYQNHRVIYTATFFIQNNDTLVASADGSPRRLPINLTSPFLIHSPVPRSCYCLPGHSQSEGSRGERCTHLPPAALHNHLYDAGAYPIPGRHHIQLAKSEAVADDGHTQRGHRHPSVQR